MSKYLVIVESPTKARTISSILGKDYEVVSSMGHLIDLPSSKLSVDVEDNYKPDYRIIRGKEKIVNQLKKKSKGKEIIYLATDSDREGEAISWHIREKLDKKGREFRRVVFHEITEDALLEAFKKPTDLDTDKVNAQIARRVLDRLVGYRLSPILWKRIVRGLSAGRVQSIALRFIVEREKEHQDFEPKTTFCAEAVFKAGEESFNAKFTKYKGRKAVFDKKEAVLKCIEKIKTQDFSVKDIITKQISRKPPSPYITSLLQQDAFNKLRFSAQKTMSMAQKLYEGIQAGDKAQGLITYMRTDSFHISPKAKKEAKDFIQSNYGKEYLSLKEHRYKKKKGAQLAHEAIRPTSIYRKPEDVAKFISEDELKLYELIWRRSVAVFMKEAVYKNTKAVINSEDAEFESSGRKVVFDGFLKALGTVQEEQALPDLEKGQRVNLEKLEATEHTTKPPPRYNDASLIKILEEKGIGRPSTYAPILFTLVRRNYVKREKRYLIPTELGVKVCGLLVDFFPEIMDENFTAHIEEELDEVEKGVVEWHKILEGFYPKFNEKVEEVLSKITKEVEYSDKICPKCRGRMILKWSRRGRFLSCEHFPKCRHAESITTGVPCPECEEGLLVERKNKRGQDFYGCSKFPECRYTSRGLPQSEENETEDA